MVFYRHKAHTKWQSKIIKRVPDRYKYWCATTQETFHFLSSNYMYTHIDSNQPARRTEDADRQRTRRPPKIINSRTFTPSRDNHLLRRQLKQTNSQNQHWDRSNCRQQLVASISTTIKQLRDNSLHQCAIYPPNGREYRHPRLLTPTPPLRCAYLNQLNLISWTEIGSKTPLF